MEPLICLWPYVLTMNPTLSRRVGRIMGLLAMAIPWEEMAAFIARVERAGGFADLPEADRQAILEAEKAAMVLRSQGAEELRSPETITDILPMIP